MSDEELLHRLALSVACPTCYAREGTECAAKTTHAARLPREAHLRSATGVRTKRKANDHTGWTCAAAHEGKRSYKSRALAERALRGIRKMGEHRDKKPSRPYRCGVCGRWFLTSRPQ
jgi:hypothetical protein